jgi:hypothetical protein
VDGDRRPQGDAPAPDDRLAPGAPGEDRGPRNRGACPRRSPPRPPPTRRSGAAATRSP